MVRSIAEGILGDRSTELRGVRERERRNSDNGNDTGFGCPRSLIPLLASRLIMHSFLSLLDTVVPLLANSMIAMYACQRFAGAMRAHWKMMAETADFNRKVSLARESVRYIGEEAGKGMEEIKEDVAKELEITDRLTKLGSKVALAVRRLADLEEKAIELMRMDRDRENVRVETPLDVNEELVFYGLTVRASKQLDLPSIDLWRQERADPELALDSPGDLLYGNELAAMVAAAETNLETRTEQTKRHATRDDSSSSSRALSRALCSCETQYEIRDIGKGHYPRYLTASRCKPNNCQSKFRSCRLLNYMVPILRRRYHERSTENRLSDDDDNDDEGGYPETPLPESIRQQWQLKPMSIAVACVPTTEGGRN